MSRKKSTTKTQAAAALEEPALPELILSTVKKPQSQNPSVDSRDLSRKARVLLGYEKLEESLAISKNQVILAKALYDLGISVYNPSAVEEYQKTKAAMARKRATSTRRRNRYNSRGSRLVVTWKKIPLHKYSRPVPVEALEKAVTIAEAVPNVTFVVEELTVRTVPKDPFLCVSVGTLKYYIAHWDEPDFHG